MKAQSKITMFCILAATAFATGCVAQAGTGEDPASTEQGLTGETIAVQDQPATPIVKTAKVYVAQPIEIGARRPQGVKQLAAPGADPGAPQEDDGDGREPDPHPWHASGGVVVGH